MKGPLTLLNITNLTQLRRALLTNLQGEALSLTGWMQEGLWAFRRLEPPTTSLHHDTLLGGAPKGAALLSYRLIE